MSPARKPRYVVRDHDDDGRPVTGINYPGPDGDERAHPGDVLEGLSDAVVKGLTRLGVIEPYEPPKKKKD